MIGKFTINDDLSIGKSRSLIAEFKNEIGSKAAELFFQATFYFLEATRKLATQHLNSVLPCIIVLIFGSLSFLNTLFILSYTSQALMSHLLVPRGPIVQQYRCCPPPSPDTIRIPI